MIPIPFEILLFIFCFGLCIGSFLNVCIYRLPISMSILYPPSSCPGCSAPIRFYDNIPVVSYLFLGGKCRKCKAPISIRYPIVEMITGLCAACVALRYGISLQGLVYFVFIAVLIVVTYIDIDHQIIPDAISLPGIILFFGASFAIPQMTMMQSVLGILLGGGMLYIVALLYSLIKKREGMGGGDIKLLAMIGALIGWKGVLFTVFVSSLAGTLAGILIMVRSRGDMKLAIPYGPFLSLGAILHVFFGAFITDWYFNLLR